MNRVIPTIAAIALSAVSGEAKAWEPWKVNSSCPDGQSFSSAPDIVIHTTEMEGWGPLDALQILDAVADVGASFTNAGGSSIDFSSISLSTEAFTFGSWYGSSSPTIHIGFDSDSSVSFPASANADQDKITDADVDCRYEEAHIRIRNATRDDGATYSWALMEPADHGEIYWDAGKELGGEHSFRVMIAHELLHTLGGKHSDTSYSLLNYADRPWARRDPGEQMILLPDDLEMLRELYPAAGSRTEAAVLNTWYDTSDINNEAAKQKMICLPSLGDEWADAFDGDNDDGYDTCGLTDGEEGSTTVCPGDTLLAGVAVSNLGTDSVDVTMHLAFSPSTELDLSADTRSETNHTFSLSAHSSRFQGAGYAVPDLPSGDYFVINGAVMVEDDGDRTLDWIPLRGMVTVPADCP